MALGWRADGDVLKCCQWILHPNILAKKGSEDAGKLSRNKFLIKVTHFDKQSLGLHVKLTALTSTIEDQFCILLPFQTIIYVSHRSSRSERSKSVLNETIGIAVRQLYTSVEIFLAALIAACHWAKKKKEKPHADKRKITTIIIYHRCVEFRMQW